MQCVARVTCLLLLLLSVTYSFEVLDLSALFENLLNLLVQPFLLVLQTILLTAIDGEYTQKINTSVSMMVHL